ncbi:hypothetical protein BCV72DRAFT_330383, partial [Rhizopus microsporus var. microsporus]
LRDLLLETSSCFGCNDRSKISFDHHKGSFGVLSMLKTTVDTLLRVNSKIWSFHPCSRQNHILAEPKA